MVVVVEPSVVEPGMVVIELVAVVSAPSRVVVLSVVASEHEAATRTRPAKRAVKERIAHLQVESH